MLLKLSNSVIELSYHDIFEVFTYCYLLFYKNNVVTTFPNFREGFSLISPKQILHMPIHKVAYMI